jgi:hypothetical protein
MDLMPRIIRIVLAPKSEWARIGAARPRDALVHMLVVSLVPAAASFLLAHEMELPQHVILATYLAALLAILSIAAAFWLLTRFDMRDAELARCIQVAAYGATPALLCVLLLPYVFYLYYLGVQELLRVPRAEAAQFVAIAVVAAAAASTLGGAGLGALL